MANHDSTIRLDFLDLWPWLSVMWERMGEPLAILGAATDAGTAGQAVGPGPPSLGTRQLFQAFEARPGH